MTLLIPGYIEERELGHGATGTVMLARHEATEQYAAIKHLSPELCTTTFLDQFRSEARLLERIDHPSVCRLYDYREEAGEAAFAMECVQGVTLRAMLDSAPLDDPCAALAVLKGSLQGLGAAHEAGIVHRDYKPENVLVETDGNSKLVDFGVAVPAGDVQWRGGTPKYMAPEQWETGEVSPSTDVYAATAVFVEALLGRPPFDGTTIPQLKAQHCSAHIPTDGVPDPLQPLVLRGLAKSPALRFDSADAFVAELESVAVSAYGEDWEKRGKKKLAALVAALAALLPLFAGGGAAAEAASFLGLGKGAAAAVGAGFLFLIGGGIAFAFVASSSGGGGGPKAAATPTPSISPSGSVLGGPTSHASASPSPSATPTPVPTSIPTDTPVPTAVPTAPPPPPPPPWTVTSVSLSFGTCTANPFTGGSPWSCPFTVSGTTSTAAGGTIQYHVDGTAWDCGGGTDSQTLSASYSDGPSTSFVISGGVLAFTHYPAKASLPNHDDAQAIVTAPNAAASSHAAFYVSPQC